MPHSKGGHRTEKPCIASREQLPLATIRENPEQRRRRSTAKNKEKLFFKKLSSPVATVLANMVIDDIFADVNMYL